MYFYKKAGSVAVVLIAVVIVIFIVIFGIRFLDLPEKSQTSRVEIQENNNKRIVVIDNVKEYQISSVICSVLCKIVWETTLFLLVFIHSFFKDCSLFFNNYIL